MAKISDAELIDAILTTENMAQAATRLGINRSTIHRRLQKADFRAKLNAAQSEQLEGACNTMRGGLQAATQCLLEICMNKKAPPQARVLAARAMLELTPKFIEIVDFDRRLTVLESALNRGEKYG